MSKFLKKTSAYLCLISLLLGSQNVGLGQSPEKAQDTKMKWFKDAKLGIFIHWGIYGVYGIPESWAFFNEYITHADYMKQLDGFTASNYNPELWASLIEESGAKYSVMGTKHHDGVALWDSKMGGYNTAQNTPAKRDVLTPFVDALRKRDIKVGLYYSLPDWSYDDYDVNTRSIKRYDIKKEPQRWNKFLTYFHGQLNELSNRYNPDLYWFDGDWEHSAEDWQADKVRKQLKDKNPNIIINSRLTPGYGDYATPEQGVPVVKPESKYWELCYTMNDSWGYVDNDHNYKTPSQLIRIFAECIGMGGNLLLDIGPKPDGTIPDEQISILKAFGNWNRKYGKAVFGTDAGLPAGHFTGPSTLSADGKSLFLFIDKKPSQKLVIKNFTAKVNEVSVLGKTIKPQTSSDGKNFWMTLAPEDCDDIVTVVELKLDKPFNAATDLIKKTNAEKFDILQLPELAGVRNNKQWLDKHAEALKNVGKGMPSTCYWGVTALSEDKETLYLFVNGKPNESLAIKGLINKVNRIRVVGRGTLLYHSIIPDIYWSAVPGVVYIDLPERDLDDDVTVIALMLKGKLDIYTGESTALESN